MNMQHHKTLIAATFLMASMVSVAEAFSDEKYEKWQLERLQNPGTTQLTQEMRGRVFIYDGLKDKDVNRILDEQFERLHSMMFIRTVVTDPQGKPKTDPRTGGTMKEDDDC